MARTKDQVSARTFHPSSNDSSLNRPASPLASVWLVARRNDINTNLLFRWVANWGSMTRGHLVHDSNMRSVQPACRSDAATFVDMDRLSTTYALTGPLNHLNSLYATAEPERNLRRRWLSIDLAVCVSADARLSTGSPCHYSTVSTACAPYSYPLSGSGIHRRRPRHRRARVATHSPSSLAFQLKKRYSYCIASPRA
jgi:hypothetical protein